MFRRCQIVGWRLVLFGASLLAATLAKGQSSTPAEAVDEENGGFVVRDSDVGYIDSAVVGNVVRLRFDAAYDFDRPNRAEYFYARSRPLGPGLPLPEIAIDNQDALLYLEHKTSECLSLFVELGIRAVDPIINQNTSGLTDINAGCKLSLLETSNLLATAQLRVYAPSGNLDRGLGTGHASLEPGLLVLRKLDAQWTASGEVRYWTAAGGSAFAGELIRYGVGLQYEPTCCHWLEPVVEVVGWTVVDGQQSGLTDPVGTVVTESAEGDTIINAKVGARVSLTCDKDLYLGYGRALTSDRWYEDTLRAELRYAY